MQHIETKKLIHGSLAAALAAVISLTISYLLPLPRNFNLPFYAIPLIIISVLYGGKFGLIVAFIADIPIGILGKYGYDPLFIPHTLMWGLIPGLFRFQRNKLSFVKILLSVFIAYLLASLCNSLAIFIRYGKALFKFSLVVRMVNTVFLSIPLGFIAYLILIRIKKEGFSLVYNCEQVEFNNVKA